VGWRRVDVGHAQGDQGVEEGGGQGPGQPVVQVELEPVGHRLDQALEADVDPGGQAEQQTQNPQPAADHDLIVVRGQEPNLRWRTFATEVVELASSLGVEMLVTVGALLADVPHTRPVQVVSSAGDRDLAERLGLNVSRYEGPTGILGVLGDLATSEGIPTVGLWAALPHYLNLAPNPWGAMALIEELRRLLPMAVDTSALADQTEAFDAAVAELVEENPELAGYIERLEADSEEDDEEGSPGLADVPPEELVAEVERYLRDHPGGSRN